MAVARNRSQQDRPSGESRSVRSAHRREMVEGLLLLAALIVLAAIARLPTG
jgi:hypothetical protein